MLGFGDYPLTFFDLFAVPRIGPKNDLLAGIADGTHFVLPLAILALALLHAAAALHHHLVRRNDVLSRMWPSFARYRYQR